MKWLVIIGGVVAAVGLFLLATASADTTLLAQHYPSLLALNATLAGLLAALVGTQLVLLARRHRARVFGTRAARDSAAPAAWYRRSRWRAGTARPLRPRRR